MDPITISAIAAIINSAISIWREHSNKPSDWVPNQEDWDSLLALVDAASPEKIKSDIALKLGIQWPPAPPVEQPVVITPVVTETPPPSA